jgi:hypothetical protein
MEMKLVILRILNQKVTKLSQLPDQTSLLFNLIQRDLGKSPNPSQTFTFMIDETDSDKKPKNDEIKNTVY